MKPVIKIENLSKKYIPSAFELDIKSLEIPKGYITGIIGKNGAGKTSLINILSSNNTDYTGDVSIFDTNIKDHSYIQKKKDISFCFEDCYYPLDWNISKTQSFIASFYDKFDFKIFNNLIKEFEIEKSKKLKMLSKGEKKKFEIALSLSHSPDLLIFDEPNSGIDPISRKQIVEKMSGYICESDNRSILFSSHIIEDIDQIADFVIFIDKGKIIEFDEKENLKTSYIKLTIVDEIPNDLKEKIFELSKTKDKITKKSSYIIPKGDFGEEIKNSGIIVENASLLDIYEFKIGI